MDHHDRRLLDRVDAAIDSADVQRIGAMAPQIRLLAASAALLRDQEKLEEIHRLGGRLTYLKRRIEPHELADLRDMLEGSLAPIFRIG